MPITVIHDSPQMVWAPLVDSTVCYVGGIVGLDALGTEGMQMLPLAAGAANTTNKDVPYGVVVGTNNKTPSYNSTAMTESITDATPLDSTTEFVGMEGPWSKGTKEAMVKVALITPSTVLRASLFNAAPGTAMTVGTVTTASGADGLDCTTNAVDVATVAVSSTIYFRTGACRGTYRVLDSASDTSHTWDKPCVTAVAVGDTCVAPNGLRPNGLSLAQLGGTYMNYIDIAAALTSDTFCINVVRLDLSTAGAEYVDFLFTGDHFAYYRT